MRKTEDRIYRLTVGGPPDTRWQRLMNTMTEQGYAAAAIRQRLGMSTPLETKDRRILEESIFPFYCDDSSFKRILFVGCAIFTFHYQANFFAEKEYWTKARRHSLPATRVCATADISCSVGMTCRSAHPSVWMTCKAENPSSGSSSRR
jgi:hypothetical protein